MSSVWDLMKAGDFEEACKAADEEFSATSSMLPLRNKVLALLNLRRYEESAALCDEIIARVGGDSDHDFIFLGVAYWLQGRHQSAITAWKGCANTTYTDAAGGIEVLLLLYYAAAKLAEPLLKRESEQRLRLLCKRSTAGNWPGPLGKFVLGAISEEQVLSQLSTQPQLRAKEMCQAAFYIAIKSLTSGNKERFLEHVERSHAQGAASLLRQEYYLARNEHEKALE